MSLMLPVKETTFKMKSVSLLVETESSIRPVSRAVYVPASVVSVSGPIWISELPTIYRELIVIDEPTRANE